MSTKRRIRWEEFEDDISRHISDATPSNSDLRNVFANVRNNMVESKRYPYPGKVSKAQYDQAYRIFRKSVLDRMDERAEDIIRSLVRR